MSRLATIFALVLLGGCAHYAPVALSSGPDPLAPPVAAVLEQQARAISRPWLPPVTLDLSAPLTPDGVGAIVILNNPDLKAARVQAGVANAQLFAAGLIPDPTFSLGANRVLSGPDPFIDLASAIGLDLNSLRTHAVTRQQAQAQAKQVRLDLAWQEWQMVGQARLQAVRVTALTDQLDLVRASALSADTLNQRVQAAAVRGDVAGDRLQSTRLTAMDADAKLRTATADLATAQGELARLLGLPPGARVRLARVTDTPSVPGADRLLTLALANRLDLQALQAGYSAQEASVHKAVLDQFPAFNLALNTNRDSAGNLLLGPTVDFTVPLWNRNRGGIAVERATRDVLKADYDARLFQTRAEIAAAAAALDTALRQRDDARHGLPQLAAYGRSSRDAARRGDLSDETAIAAEQALRDRQLLIAQSEQAIQEQLIALELLTGTPREAWNR